MGTTTIATNTTSGLRPTAGDSVYVPFGVLVADTGGEGIHVQGATPTTHLLIDGTVVGLASFGISIVESATTHQGNFILDIGESGIVRSGASHPLLNSGVIMSGSNNLLVNRGEISGVDGVLATGTASSGVGQSIENHGTINGWGDAGIVVKVSGSNIVNTGTIAGAKGVLFSYSTSFDNSGTVIGRDGPAVDGRSVTGEAIFFRNSGLVTTGESVLQIAVGLGYSDDTLINRGVIEGDVMLGDGLDIYKGRGGTVAGTVKGGLGGDILTGGAGDDTLDGEEADDVLNGLGGDDTLIGGVGNDDLRGGFGDDMIMGGADDDVLNGGGDDDTLIGEGGNDDLRGGRGDDVIIGGADNDDMWGGRDADTFQFAGFGGGGPGGVPTDHIHDFEKGADVIDLQPLPGRVAFGTKAFKGGGVASIVVSVKKGDTIVKVDEDGDKHMDGKIIVDDVTGLTAHDFIL
ncbi:MAG: calcium-binding protein [Alphaproteobacteria bacterium]|nr:MAG: calcium-binding protein [Alphaproteobacteria bacterium]